MQLCCFLTLSSMRRLLDQGLPRGATRLLTERRHNALHVGDIGMSVASDVEILQFSAKNERVVVTLDADFHALLARSSAGKPSVIRIRVEGCKAPRLVDLLIIAAEKFASDLKDGCAITILNGKFRLRRLPIR